MSTIVIGENLSSRVSAAYTDINKRFTLMRFSIRNINSQAHKLAADKKQSVYTHLKAITVAERAKLKEAAEKKAEEWRVRRQLEKDKALAKIAEQAEAVAEQQKQSTAPDKAVNAPGEASFSDDEDDSEQFSVASESELSLPDEQSEEISWHQEDELLDIEAMQTSSWAEWVASTLPHRMMYDEEESVDADGKKKKGRKSKQACDTPIRRYFVSKGLDAANSFAVAHHALIEDNVGCREGVKADENFVEQHEVVCHLLKAVALTETMRSNLDKVYTCFAMQRRNCSAKVDDYTDRLVNEIILDPLFADYGGGPPIDKKKKKDKKKDKESDDASASTSQRKRKAEAEPETTAKKAKNGDSGDGGSSGESGTSTE